MQKKRFDLRKDQLEHIDAAKEFYLNEFSTVTPISERKRRIEALGYFDILKIALLMGSTSEIFKISGMRSYGNFHSRLKHVQYRIDLYLKMKSLGGDNESKP